MSKRDSYHHGDLRAALVEAALALIAERGIDALSVAEAARRTGVSAAAPYRHFPTRLALLKAAATRAAELLAEGLREVQEPDPVEALAATARVYVRFVVEHHAGLDLIFAEQLRPLADPALAAAGRAVIDVLLPIALALTGNPVSALDLLEQHIAAAHGYAVLHLSGFARRRTPDVEMVATGAANVSRALAAAFRG
ncbi:TetR/AcrR family transcriptional regulator [Amycolatopsis sp. GM8]|uniref:TetR/AcrR family transcriptional regulator n=1 Tax=Amycolatopsis sp. GM8 TaxID=2896530 RepID=UPI001F446825|nr:TetR/AcrR family transcriptional regulator [Amycolatopsis sp. GM8]